MSEMYREKYNNLYSILDRYSSDFKKHFPNLIDEPYIDNIITTISQINDPNVTFASYDAAIVTMGYLWNKYKISYSVDESFLNYIGDTEDIELNVDVLKRLPYNTFFIKTGKLGYLVYVEVWDSVAGFYVADVADAKPSAINCVLKNLWIKNGFSIEDSVDDIIFRDQYIRRKNGLQTHSQDEQDDIAEKMQGLFLKIVNFCLYLSAQNAVITPKKTQKKNRPVSTTGKRLNVKEWEVGYRIVESPYKEIAEVDIKDDMLPSVSGGHASPRPHMRRAHWHHYWIGREGEKRLVLKWIEPVWVMGNSEKIIPTEVRI